MRYDTGRPRVVIRFRCAVLRCAPALRVTLARLAAAQSALMAEQDLSAILTAVPGGRSEQPSRPKRTREGPVNVYDGSVRAWTTIARKAGSHPS